MPAPQHVVQDVPQVRALIDALLKIAENLDEQNKRLDLVIASLNKEG